MAFTWYERLLGRFARATSARRVWYRWPFPIAMASLVGLRSTMRERNLFDCETAPLPADPPRPDIKVLSEGRTVDGSYNDLGAPRMGMAGARFGRNVPISETFGENSPGLYEIGRAHV